jgi:uncharacterized protein YkuJ
MSAIIAVLNQLFEIQEKINNLHENDRFERNMNRLYNICEQEGFEMKNPIQEKFNDSRTDVEANIVGKLGANMMITQVIKPCIYQTINGQKTLVQKAIVIVENK